MTDNLACGREPSLTFVFLMPFSRSTVWTRGIEHRYARLSFALGTSIPSCLLPGVNARVEEARH